MGKIQKVNIPKCNFREAAMKHLIKTFGFATLFLISILIVSCGQSVDGTNTLLTTMVDETTEEATETLKADQEQQELEAAWQEYYTSWNELKEAFDDVATDWQEIPTYWNEVTEGWQEIGQTWDTVATDWHDLDQARVIVNDSLGILLTDAEPRLTRDVYVRSSFQTITRKVTIPTQPQQTTGTVGTWAELDSAWDDLNNAWSSTDEAFAELNSAWAELYEGYDEIALAWPFVSQAFQQISDAYDAVDNA